MANIIFLPMQFITLHKKIYCFLTTALTTIYNSHHENFFKLMQFTNRRTYYILCLNDSCQNGNISKKPNSVITYYTKHQFIIIIMITNKSTKKYLTYYYNNCCNSTVVNFT